MHTDQFITSQKSNNIVHLIISKLNNSMDLTDCISSYLDTKLHMCSLFLDFSKEYDILLHTMRYTKLFDKTYLLKIYIYIYIYIYMCVYMYIYLIVYICIYI